MSYFRIGPAVTHAQEMPQSATSVNNQLIDLVTTIPARRVDWLSPEVTEWLEPVAAPSA
jgi:hypothetical protein